MCGAVRGGCPGGSLIGCVQQVFVVLLLYEDLLGPIAGVGVEGATGVLCFGYF